MKVPLPHTVAFKEMKRQTGCQSWMQKKNREEDDQHVSAGNATPMDCQGQNRGSFSDNPAQPAESAQVETEVPTGPELPLFSPTKLILYFVIMSF